MNTPTILTGGDYAAPGILAEAVRGADAVFVNIGALREHAGELISAARGTEVSKIVMLSTKSAPTSAIRTVISSR
jgi:hypothetical protein